MKSLTATEIKKRVNEYFSNSSPEMQEVDKAFKKLQDAIFLPLIKRMKQLLRN